MKKSKELLQEGGRRGGAASLVEQVGPLAELQNKLDFGAVVVVAVAVQL